MELDQKNSVIINSIDDYLDLLIEIKAGDDLRKILFRGQAQEYETLHPRLFIKGKINDANNESENIIKNLNSCYKNVSIENTDSIANFLIEIQQKGTFPTRLLDY